MTKRPTGRDLAVRLKAAEMALPAVADWLGADFEEKERESIVEQIADALGRSSDGYEICTHLEKRHGWCPDALLVELLDEQFVWNAEQEAVQEWAKSAEMKPEFQIGDQIAFNWYGSTWTAGTIEKIYDDSATYSVRMDHQKAFALVPFEAAKALPPVEPETSQSDETLLDKVDSTDKSEQH